MEWSKLKNIILIILAITNLTLLVFVLYREFQESRLQRQARSEAILFLNNRRIQLEEELVPDGISLQPRTAQRVLEQEGAAASRLLGEGVQAEARGAEVYRYSNEKGWIQFHSDGAFSAELASGAFPVGEERAADCLELLAGLEFSGELVEESGSTLIFRQLWEDQPLFNHQVTLEIRDGCISTLSGRRLTGQPVEDTTRTTVGISTALVSFLNGLNALGDVCSRIEGITEGYVTSVALSGPMVLTPVWQIATDTGAYQLDLVTGELTRDASRNETAASAA